MNPEIEVIVRELEQTLHSKIGMLIAPTALDELRTQLEMTMARIAGKQYEAIAPHVKFRMEGRDELVPDNFYTGLLMVCGQMGLECPAPSEVKDSFNTEVGEFTWNHEKRCMMFRRTQVLSDIVVTSLPLEAKHEQTP